MFHISSFLVQQHTCCYNIPCHTTTSKPYHIATPYQREVAKVKRQKLSEAKQEEKKFLPQVR
jgi:hypothetical protein